MTIYKYKATAGYFPSINQIMVDRESDSSVWINGRRIVKVTSYESFFKTFREAKAHIVGIATEKVRCAEARVRSANESLKEAEKIVEAA